MQILAKQLKFLAPYLVVAIATLAAGVGFWFMQNALLATCGVSDVSCTTFTDYALHDPLCVIDPSCVSPFYHPYTSGVQRWIGMQGWNLAESQQPPDGANFLAIPNYILFMLLAITAVAIISRKAHSSRSRKLALTAVFIWCITETASWWWFALAGLRGHQPSHVALLQACGTIVLSLSLLGWATYWAERDRRTRST